MEETRKENPYDLAGVISRIFFWWFNKIAINGLNRKFEEKDLCKHPKAEDSEYLGNLLQKEWDVELKTKNPSLLKSVLRVFGSKCILIYTVYIFQECFLLIFQSYLVGIMIDYFEYKFQEKVFAYSSAAGVCVCMLLHIITFHIVVFNFSRLNIKIAAAISNIIYKKSLKLSHASLGKSHIGQMVNLLSNDISKFQKGVNFSIQLILAPLQLIIMMIMLWQYLGPAMLAGMSVLLLYVPLQIGFSKTLSSLRFKTAKFSDKRLRLLNELLTGMRVLKMYAWELLFAKSIEETRRKELQSITKTLYIYGIPLTMGIIMTKLMMFFSFFTYFMIEENLTATIAFVTSSLLANTYRTLFYSFPQGSSIVIEINVSLRRFQDFLLLEEKPNTIDVVDSRPCVKDCGVWAENIFAYWNKDAQPTLENITFNAHPGDLLVIVGPVGSGKTSLQMTLLGEIPISSGKVKLRGKVSYTSQEAWIYNGTIRENILFFENYHKKKYERVLYVSALKKDISDLPKGDLTLVGERGRIMSGGQKARINLARALYQDADIYILDDPLSAVDAPVAKHIFENCIMKYLKDKVTILATHQVQFLKSATNIIVLNEGKIQAVGHYNELVKLGINFGLLSHELKTNDENISEFPPLSFHDKSIPASINSSNDENNAMSDNSIKQEKIEDKRNKYETDDDRRKAKFSRRTVAFISYINSGVGMIFQLCLLFLFILTQAVLNASEYWIVKWTKRDFKNITEKNEIQNCTMKSDMYISNCTMNKVFADNQDDLNMFVYSGLMLGLVIASLITIVSYFTMCRKCSINLHKNLLHCMIRVPISFLDKNPVGKLLSRFSRDMCIVDQQLPVSTLMVINVFLNILGMIALQIIIQPYLIIPSFALLIATVMLAYLFLGITSDIHRLEGKTSSPIFSHITKSLYGISTIRALKVERCFEYAFDKYQNKHNSCKFLYIGIFHWIVMKLQVFCFLNIVISTVTVFNVSSLITGSEVGLIMSYSLAIMILFPPLFTQIILTEGQFISTERIIDYSRLSSEASLASAPNKRPPDDWPQKGYIEFYNVSLKYEGDTQNVLKNLNFRIKSGEKIGIVGRTGAGKSSIIAALFRMIETTGVITIDGVVTKDIGLHDLRSKISIIPQDPLLFSRSLRKNIDPFDKYTDESLWRILEEVQLKKTVQNLKGGLDAELSDGGNNFSVGQRQLICLARAILHSNKIIVLDEATAFIDKETDSLIQRTIREKFSSSTIITIAHRLQTIMDSDRVMVLQDGQIEEFDEPYVLLKNTKSIFYNMTKKTGKEMRKHLYTIAKEAYLETNDESQNMKTNDDKLNFPDRKTCKANENDISFC